MIVATEAKIKKPNLLLLILSVCMRAFLTLTRQLFANGLLQVPG